MASFTHRKKDYRVTAILLKYDMELGNGQKGLAGEHFFICDEEEEQYLLEREKFYEQFRPISFVKIIPFGPEEYLKTF